MRFVNTPYDGIEYLEIPITLATQRKFAFPLTERLDGKIIRRIDLVARPNGLTPSGRTVIANDKLVQGYLTIRPKNSVTLYKYPLFYILNSSGSSGNETLTTEILNYQVGWELSFVEFAQTVTLSTAQSLLFIIYYQDAARKSLINAGLKYLVNPLVNLFTGNEELYTIPIQVEIDNINKTQFNFSLLERFEHLKLKKIQLAEYSVTITPDYKNNITSDTILRKSYLVLRDYKGKEIINHLPLYQTTYPQVERSEILLNNLEIDWPKSYVHVVNNASLVAGTVFFFILYYTKK
jgi:hypothetical protein